MVNCHRTANLHPPAKLKVFLFNKLQMALSLLFPIGEIHGEENGERRTEKELREATTTMAVLAHPALTVEKKPSMS
jgi:hypothetical protein